MAGDCVFFPDTLKTAPRKGCAASMKKTVVRAGFVFDSATGRLEEKWGIVLEGGLVEAAGPLDELELPEIAEALDLSDMTILPGLADCHVHYGLNGETSWETAMLRELVPFQAIRAAEYARRDLEAGFTMVRAEGDKGFLDAGLRQAIEGGWAAGPRMAVSGHMLSATGGRDSFAPGVSPGDALFRTCDGPDEVARASREQMKYGADWIKLAVSGAVTAGTGLPGAQQFTSGEILAAVTCAHMNGKKVSAHAHGAESVKAAIRAGADSIEHACLADEESLRMMADFGTWWIPTLAPVHLICSRGAEGGVSSVVLERSRTVREHHLRLFSRALELGVRILPGTDAGMPFSFHGNNALELELMAGAGMSPKEVLRSSTCRSAEMLGWQERCGRISRGCFADLVGVRGNPLENISLLRSVSFVMKGGQVIRLEAPQKGGRK